MRLVAAKPQIEPSEMPSYEEMIAQAIAEIADPDGTAPKVLFQWMDQHYPLQTNFRPSASQALQRAYKRGRLDKLPSGRYILNPTWDGAPTSKRATRRPKQVKVESGAPISYRVPPTTRATTNGATPNPYPYVAPLTRTMNGKVEPRETSMDVDELEHGDTPAPESAPAAPPATTAPIIPVVKMEPVDAVMATPMDLDPDIADSVHGLFATLAKQLADLQAERRKGKPR
ncbi:hypothetical protein EXIGLDRAFT_111161 [Exidia glandulosa HHB12029]|uniref:Histone H1 n=1 Tax=Exidia glandulosa HHB12029 TaxID=1314781 RepID=A0A165NKK1_EXIGL|nr:hypothetical protein EXIGLDRAFT_111161 [Exidia glandulosa HHB12029]